MASSNRAVKGWAAWWRFAWKDRLTAFGCLVVLFALIVALLGALVRPDSSVHANNQLPAIALQPPGFSVQIVKLKKESSRFSTPFYKKFLFGGELQPPREIAAAYTYVSNDTLNYLEYGYPDSSWQQQLALNQIEPYSATGHVAASRTYWLGTDKFGRDMLSRLMAGTVVSLSVGFISVFISLLIGVILGAIAGYYRGRIDDVISWLINVVWSVPTLLMVIAITFALGKGFVQVFIAVGLTMWVEVARVVRGQVIALREREFVEAARALGYSGLRIIRRHILPNVWGPVIVICAANFATAILLEAGLSFLGIGAQVPMPSWGQMIKDHYPYITTNMAYLAVAPGLAMVMLVLAFTLIGNGLRDFLDVRATPN